jgi:hypothetical protein
MSEPTEPTTTTTATTILGRRTGRTNYTREEMTNFLDIMEGVLPIGGEEWDEVFQQHSVLYPGRDINSLRRKYGALYRKGIPTGDPNCPPEVRQAKRVKYKIGDKANIGDGEEEYDLEGGTFAPNNDDEDDEDADAPPPVPPPFEPAGDGVLAQRTPPTQTQTQTQEDVSVARTPPPSTRARTPTLSMSSNSSSSGKRDSTSSGKRGQEDFLELYRLQILQESEARKAQMEQESESRKALVESLGAIAAGFASAFAGRNKRSRDIDSDSSKRSRDIDSDSS